MAADLSALRALCQPLRPTDEQLETLRATLCAAIDAWLAQAQGRDPVALAPVHVKRSIGRVRRKERASFAGLVGVQKVPPLLRRLVLQRIRHLGCDVLKAHVDTYARMAEARLRSYVQEDM